MTEAGATIFVCVSCRRRLNGGSEDDYDEPGRALAAALKRYFAEAGASAITVEPVVCLAVCKRPCTIAVKAAGKWTYLIGDLDAESDVGEIAEAALSYLRSADGIVPWAERPPAFRRGVVARVPPLEFKQPETP